MKSAWKWHSHYMMKGTLVRLNWVFTDILLSLSSLATVTLLICTLCVPHSLLLCPPPSISAQQLRQWMTRYSVTFPEATIQKPGTHDPLNQQHQEQQDTQPILGWVSARTRLAVALQRKVYSFQLMVSGLQNIHYFCALKNWENRTPRSLNPIKKV